MRRMSTSGFTIVELMVVVTVTTILAGVLFGPLDSLYSANSNSMKKIVQISDTHTSLRSVQDGISQASGFLAANSVADPSGTNWNYSNSGVYNVLITSAYATSIDAPKDTTNIRALIFDNSTCSQPLSNNYVYFLSSGNLYRRTLANTASTCGGVAVGQKQTCASGNTAAYCKAVDAKLASGVSSFTVQYFGNPSDTTTITDPTAATTVVLNITLQSGTGSQLLTTTNNLRITHLD